MKPNAISRIDSLSIPQDAKDSAKKLIEASKLVEFGMISSRQEGYIFGDYKLPRCTSVLKMDGTKTDGLLYWARKEVVKYAYDKISNRIKNNRKKITAEEVEAILNEAGNEPDKQKDDAARKGTAVHDNIENYLTGYQYIVDESIGRFIKAWESAKVICIATEIPVVWYDKDGCGFGGRIDMLCYADGKWLIGDNKTSKSVHETYALQISSYGKAVEQMTGGLIKPEGGIIFHIPDEKVMNDRQKMEYNKRGSLVRIDNLEEAFEHYRLLLGLYYRRNNKYF